MLISSFTLKNGTVITPLLLFYLQLSLVCTKIHCFVEYTQKKCFKRFVQAAVDARRNGDENSNSSVVAETKKLQLTAPTFTRSWTGAETPYRSTSLMKKHTAINSKMFKKLDHVNISLYEVELDKAQIEHKEPIIVGFFFHQYAKRRNLELSYNLFTKFCDVNKFEVLQMDTDLLYLALAGKGLEDCIRPETRAEWLSFRSNYCVDSFTADAVANFFPRTCFVKHKQHDKREPGLFKEEFNCSEMFCPRSKTYCCNDVTSKKL